MSRDDREYTIPDTRRAAWLADVGGARWGAAVCVNSAGDESLWLIGPCDDCECGCSCAGCAPHEQGGPVRYPCAAVARSGRPCRNKVRRPGGLCPSHERWPADQVRPTPPIHDRTAPAHADALRQRQKGDR